MTERPQPCLICGHPQTPDYRPVSALGKPYPESILLGYSCKRDHSPQREFIPDEYQ